VIAYYRHTQTGWVILAVLAAGGLMVVLALPQEAAGAAAVPLAILGLVAALFGALRVEVDMEAIGVRLGIGLIRKRIPLADVAAWRAVRNPWYAGWGIRMGPTGVLWNVSGLDAVELDLPAGRHFRIGTDEPEALVAAITQAKGVAASPPPAADTPGRARAAPKGVGMVALGLVLAGLLAIGAVVWIQARPVAVRVGPEGIVIDTPFYGTTLAAGEIAAFSLEPGLPRVLRRTNGFAAAGSLRGHFRLEGLGDGRLYVELGHPPYLFVRIKQGFVFVNLPEPGRTRTLFDEAARLWPDRAAAPRHW
jgi:hypothetical protein